MPQPDSQREASPGASITAPMSDEWRAYYQRVLREEPRRSDARDYMLDDLRGALARLVPSDASVLEVGCGRGDLIGSLPHRRRVGIDWLPEAIAEARARHAEVDFRVDDVLAEASELRSERFDAVICDRLGHNVSDVHALLGRLRERLTDRGRIYLVTFNFLWELPTRAAEALGWKIPSPTSNWLSDTDFKNLFDFTDLEVVKFEDRMTLPLPVPGATRVVNQVLGRLPVLQRFSLYRVYVLRARKVEPAAPPAGQGASVSVIVPTRNEAGNVAAAIARTPVMGRATELIFVEGGSTDGTWDTIQQALASYRGPLQLSAYQQTGKGKGDAVRLGFAKARHDLFMILDADLTVPPEDLPRFYEAATRGRADFIQGTRLVYPMDPGAMRFFNKLGNVGFSLLFSYLLAQPIKDTLCGTKVLWRTDYERIAAGRSVFGDFDPFGDFDLIFGAARLNLKIAELPVRYRERVYGETNIQRWRHGWLLLKMSAVAARKLKFV